MKYQYSSVKAHQVLILLCFVRSCVAQSLATEHKKPLVFVHHLVAHCLTARLPTSNTTQVLSSATSVGTESAAVAKNSNATLNAQFNVRFPFLALVASGGHTNLILCHSTNEYSILGGALDDALGECLDKGARMLGIFSVSSMFLYNEYSCTAI